VDRLRRRDTEAIKVQEPAPQLLPPACHTGGLLRRLGRRAEAADGTGELAPTPDAATSPAA
jgi:hypothetical protein